MTARFASTPLGPGLAVNDGGITLTTLAGALSLARAARSEVSHTTGTHGAEFASYAALGDSPSLAAAVGLVQPGASLSAMVGVDAASVGWRLDTGQVFAGNVLLVSGLPIPDVGAIVGLRARLDADAVDFYLGDTLVHTAPLGVSGATWHFAASMGSTVAGELSIAVNSGQWQALSPAAAAGWRAPEPQVAAVRLADIDWLSAAADTPPHARFEGIIDQAGVETLAELDFWPWGGSRGGAGAAAQLTVLDGDGILDALALGDADGVAVALQQVDVVGTLAAATPVARMVCDRIEVQGDDRKLIQLRDAHDDLDRPLARGVFLPNIPSLAWNVQPVVIGAVASAPALLANSDGTVGFLADSPLAHVATVLDRGDPHEPADWSLDPSSQQLLLQSPPVGPVTADVSSIGPGMAPATLEQALTAIFARIGKAAWSGADAAAIDAATGYAGIGYYAGDAVTVRVALAAILASYGAGWWQDGDGVLRFARVVAPEAAASTFELDSSDLGADAVVTPDYAPNLTRRMGYRPNARVLGEGELVTDLQDVPRWRRRELTAPFRGQVYGAGPLAARYRTADQAPPMVSLFWQQQDAQAEIDRIVALYAAERRFYRWQVAGNPTLDLKPGQVGTITYPRYGLEAGRQVLVRGVQRNPVTGTVTLTFWGA